MTNMRNIISAFGCLALGISASAEFTQADDTPPSQVESLARFVGGEWHTAGAWASGEKLRSRNVFTWGVGKKIIHGKTFVINEGKDHLQYESVMTWHPKHKTLVIYSFSVDGVVNEYAIDTPTDDTLKFGFAALNNESSNVRQTITFKTKDAYLWTVQVKQNNTWQEIIQSTWHRKPFP